MSEINIFGITISSWIIIPVIFLVWVTVLLFIKRGFFKVIKRISKKTKTQIDDIFIQSIDFPLTLLILASGGAIVETDCFAHTGNYAFAGLLASAAAELASRPGETTIFRGGRSFSCDRPYFIQPNSAYRDNR